MNLTSRHAIGQQVVQRALHARKVDQLGANLFQPRRRHSAYASAIASVSEVQQRRNLVQRKPQSLRPLDESDAGDQVGCVVPDSTSRRRDWQQPPALVIPDGLDSDASSPSQTANGHRQRGSVGCLSISHAQNALPWPVPHPSGSWIRKIQIRMHFLSNFGITAVYAESADPGRTRPTEAACDHSQLARKWVSDANLNVAFPGHRATVIAGSGAGRTPAEHRLAGIAGTQSGCATAHPLRTTGAIATWGARRGAFCPAIRGALQIRLDSVPRYRAQTRTPTLQTVLGTAHRAIPASSHCLFFTRSSP